MNKIQIYYPDSDLINQVKIWLSSLQKTEIELTQDDDYSRIEITTEFVIHMTRKSNALYVHIGPAVIVAKVNQYECISIN